MEDKVARTKGEGKRLVHDAYGKKVLKEAVNDFEDSRPTSFGADAGTFRIDGTIGKDIAVEIESRASKQVRGAVVDVIWHPFPKKLLILITKYNNRFTENQCREILKRFSPDHAHEVVTLKGNGHDDRTADDVEIIQKAVERLRKV